MSKEKVVKAEEERREQYRKVGFKPRREEQGGKAGSGNSQGLRRDFLALHSFIPVLHVRIYK
jgi:hypothetical protein